MLRRPAPDENDVELIFLAAVLGGAMVLFIGMHLPFLMPHCAFRTVTGIPCLTCGSTHSLQALLQRNWLMAIRWNPLCVLTIAAIIMGAIYAVITLVFRLPRIRIINMNAREILLMRLVVVILIAIDWVYVIITQSRLR
ncbi:MAG: DUF2752 domain-containing protein [Chthoniobacterales bacterium]